MLSCLEAFIYLLPSQGKFKLLSVVSEEVLYNPTTPVLPPACHELPPPMPMCLLLSALLPSLKDFTAVPESVGFLHPPKLQRTMLCCNCEVRALPVTKFWAPPEQGPHVLLSSTLAPQHGT